jgi:hypothetical protein
VAGDGIGDQGCEEEGWPKGMTPLQFARAQCANFDSTTGGCKGIGIKDDGSLFNFGKKPHCVLADNKPCAYFETCVLPMGIDPCNAVNKVRAEHQAEAKHIYAQFSPNYHKTPPRKCRACHRRPVAGGKRYCPECAEDRKRKATVESNQRRRHDGKTPLESPANISPNGGAKPDSISP